MLEASATGGNEDGIDHRGARPRASTAWVPTAEGGFFMSARLLPGGPVAESILADVSDRVRVLKDKGVTPALATILVGDDDASYG
jgi:hypothetical protein